jgi:hypothetical protein
MQVPVKRRWERWQHLSRSQKIPAGMLAAVIWLLAEMSDNGREVYKGGVQQNHQQTYCFYNMYLSVCDFVQFLTEHIYLGRQIFVRVSRLCVLNRLH